MVRTRSGIICISMLLVRSSKFPMSIVEQMSQIVILPLPVAYGVYGVSGLFVLLPYLFSIHLLS